MHSRLLVPGIALFIFGLVFAAEARVWTDAATGRTLQGEFLSADDANVRIKLANGTTVSIPIARLNAEDQAFIKAQPKPEPKKAEGKGMDDLKRQLIGTWAGDLVNSDGSRQGGMWLKITETEITSTDARGERVLGAGTYSVKAGGRFHQIDTRGTQGQYEGKDYDGIFTLEDGTLKWCSPNDRARGRPGKLETDLRAGYFLMVLKRQG